MIIRSIEETIGNTPIVKVHENIEYFAKLEGFNLFGSVKDRAARYILEQLYQDNVINKDTEIIESSSGNFGIALAGMCMITGNKFTCVIDPNITESNKKILELFNTNLICSKKMDKNGNYILGRIEKVKELVKLNKNIYWTNQYGSRYVWESYYYTLGQEICDELDKLDYLFIAVSTCGTLAGTSRKVKEKFPNVKIIAVDIAGSQIFSCEKKSRHISGIGTGFVPKNLRNAIYDDFVIVEEIDAVEECNNLLKKGISVGGSSGAIAYAIKNYKFNRKNENNIILGIFPDKGERYVDTIYDETWYKNKILNLR